MPTAKKVDKRIYYPLLASEELTGGMVSDAEIKAVWDTFRGLTEDKKNILLSDELPERLLALHESMHCKDSAIEGVSVLVRWYLFDEIDEQGLSDSLKLLFPQQATQVLDFLKREVFSLKPKPRVEDQIETPKQQPRGKTVKLPLLKALAEYPRVGEQMVTSDKLKLRNQPEPQRPTLANWIRCYRDELGVGMHDQVTRGRFLFQSENGKKLSTQDRDRINLIIKSLEEEYPLDVDTDRMQIVFTASTAPAVQAPATAAAPKLTFPSAPQAAPERPVRPYTPPAQAAPAVSAPAPVSVGAGKGSFLGVSAGPAKNVAGDTLHFSTGHVLPGEKSANPAPTPVAPQPAASAAAYPMTGINRTPGTPLRNPYSIRPLRLRNTALDREVDAR